MNKRLVWISAMTVLLSVSLIAPALAVESPAAAPATAETPAITAPATTSAPVVTTDDFAPKTVPVVTVAKPVVKKAAAKTVVKKSSKKRSTKRTVRRRTTTTRRTATTASVKPASTSSNSGNDLETAESVLRSLQAKYRYLDGVSVRVGTTPGGYQAVAYYSRGVIVISPKHTASISTILRHEVWHVIDYRDNGKIDWGERVAPKNAADYLK